LRNRLKQTAPFVSAGVIVGLCTALAISGCSATASLSGAPKEGRLIDTVKSEQFDYGVMAVGRDNDLNLHRADGLGLVHAPALTGYSNAVLARLIEASPMPSAPARVYLQATPQWGASASADANIYLNLGLVMALESEDELAAVLAHELSHVILGHTSSDVVEKSQQQMIMLTEVAEAVEMGLVASGQIDGSVVADENVREYEGYLLQLNTSVLSPGWNRRQETQADVLGADIMIKAGYNKVAVLTVLAKQAEWEKNQPEKKPPPPGTGPKIDLSAEPDVVLKQSLAVAGSGMMKAFGSISKKHRSADKRQETMQTYINREYRRAPRPAIKKMQWQMMVGAGSNKELLDNYNRAFDAEEKIVAGDLAGAESDLLAAVSGPTSAHAYPRFVFYALRHQQGNAVKALQNLEIAYMAPEPSVKIFQTASMVHIEAGRVDQAVELLEQAYLKFDSTPALMPDLIKVYRLAGRGTDADKLALHCALEYPQYRELCEPEEPSAA